MVKGLVSIIVPIYKVDELFLKKCILSIKNQSYEELEILLIDDGSPDNSGAICDAFALEDNRIKVIHIENQGVSNARNVGLKMAKGEYITFADSDDYMNKNMIRQLVDVIENTGADCAKCSCETVDEAVEVDTDAIDAEIQIQELSRDEAIDTLVYMKRSFEELEITAVWGTLYRKSSMKEDFFDVSMSVGEDFVFQYNYMKHISKLAVCSARYYIYVLHKQSMMRNGFQRKKINSIKSIQELVEKEHNSDYRAGLICRAVNIGFVILFMIPIAKEYTEERKLVIAFIKKYRNNVLNNKKARMKVKLAIIVSYFGFSNTQRLFQMIQK